MSLVATFLTLCLAADPADPGLPEPPPPLETSNLVTLNQALQNTDDHLPAILAAVANTDAARGRMTEARGPMLPQVFGGAALVGADYFGSASQIGNNSQAAAGAAGAGTTGTAGTGSTGASGNTAITGVETADQDGFHTALTLTATQLLWDFGNTYNRYRSIRRSVDQYQFTENETRVEAHQTTRSAYYNAHALKGLVDVARETFKNETQHLKQTEALVKVGQQPPIALATEKTTYANDVFQIFQSQGNYLQGKSLLNQAMGIEGSLDYDVETLDAPPVQGEDSSVDDLMPDALATRPAYLAADAQVEAQQYLVSSYKGALGPTLGLEGVVTASATNPHNWGGDVIGELVLNWTLFNGLTNFGNIHEQEADLVSLRATRDQLRQQIRVDLETAAVSVRTAKSGLASAAAAVFNAHEQLRLAEARYKAGAGSIIELGDAQVAYTTAEVQLISAQYTLNNARATLMAKIGRG